MSGRVELAVVGGGPAGLALGIAARRAGLSVVVVEAGAPPIDKACGEGLMPGGLAALETLGIPAHTLPGVPFEGIRYIDGTGPGAPSVAEARFFEGPGRGIERRALHAALVDAAGRAGVDLRFKTRFEGLALGGIETSRGRVEALLVAGADGLHSAVARAAGLELGRAAGKPRAWLRGPLPPHRRYGVRRHVAIAPSCPFVEIHWARGAEAYVTPVASDMVGVALLVDAEVAGAPRFDAQLARFPALAERLAGHTFVSPARGAGPFPRRVRGVLAHPPGAPPVALVGDASGYVDPITGEGLSLAFRHAEALVAAHVAGRLADYPRAHRRIVLGPTMSTGMLLAIARRPALRRRVVAALAADPPAFARTLAAHNGTIPPHRLGLRTIASLARGLVAA